MNSTSHLDNRSVKGILFIEKPVNSRLTIKTKRMI